LCGLGLVGHSWFLVGLACFDCVVGQCDCVGCFTRCRCVAAADVGVGVVVVVAVGVGVVVAVAVAVVIAVVVAVVALVVADECRGCFFLCSWSKAEEEAVSLDV
jgi:hypothetical protein